MKDCYEDDERDEGSVYEACIECGDKSVGDICDQCGMPLCPMHYELGAGFCKDHPNKHFRGW